MIAACDKKLAGKILKDDKKSIDFFVNPRFYKEHEGTKKDVKAELLQAADANLVGEEAVSCGLEVGAIEKSNIITIDGVPHAIYTAIHGH